MNPFSALYGAITALRNWLYDRQYFSIYHSQIPVLSIGNTVAGGSGKSPLVSLLVKLLTEMGFRPVVLSRGYGGSLVGPHLVQATKNSFREVGDEPLMLARDGLTVVVSRSRSAGARFIESQALGNVIVLDDGFQHRALDRALDIVSVDTSSLSTAQAAVTGELLPVGRARERWSYATRRMNVVVCNARSDQRNSEAEAFVRKNTPAILPMFCAWYDCLRVKPLHNGATQLQANAEVIVVSSIAKPEAFIEQVRRLGFVVKHTALLPDHSARFSQIIAEELKRGLPILCTAKDVVKLELDNLSVDAPIYVVAGELKLDDRDGLKKILGRVLVR